MLTPGRRFRFFLSVVLILCLAASVAAITYKSRAEVVNRMWAVAKVDGAGNASITEQIDYDFAGNSRHGIYRIVPGLRPVNESINVTSPDAPDQTTLTYEGDDTKIRIGDPYSTTRGQHRYTISYPLSTLERSTSYGWNVHGTEWVVGATEVEGTLIAPVALKNVRCFRGIAGSTKECSATQPSPGVVTVHAKNLRPYEGVTIYADKAGAATASVAAPDAPTKLAARTGMDALPAGVVALICAMLGFVITGRRMFFAGREVIGVGGATDAAHSDGDGPTRRVDAAELESMATIEFAPPEGLLPSQGGVLLKESVEDNHKAAWIMAAVAHGRIDIENWNETVTLVDKQPREPDAVLDQLFEGRDRVGLGKYDRAFSVAWLDIGTELEKWRSTSGLWDHAAESRAKRALGLGGIWLFVAAGVSAFGAFLVGRVGVQFLPVVIAGTVGFGVSIAAVSYARELRVRTAAGSGLWLRTESFRRFLAQSEAQHVDKAASLGMLREYTAWAVAVGEVNRWNWAMNASSIPPQVRKDSFLAAAPLLTSAAATASTEPASSSSSSGGGSSSSSSSSGGSGGGGGGGGGGSW